MLPSIHRFWQISRESQVAGQPGLPIQCGRFHPEERASQRHIDKEGRIRDFSFLLWTNPSLVDLYRETDENVAIIRAKGRKLSLCANRVDVPNSREPMAKDHRPRFSIEPWFLTTRSRPWSRVGSTLMDCRPIGTKISDKYRENPSPRPFDSHRINASVFTYPTLLALIPWFFGDYLKNESHLFAFSLFLRYSGLFLSN